MRFVIRQKNAEQALTAVLEAYGFIAQQHHGSELARSLHHGPHIVRADASSKMVRELLERAAAEGAVRDDVTADELASYALHALTAASDLPAKAAVRRLVGTIRAGLRPGA
jgi:hypothetical protein